MTVKKFLIFISILPFIKAELNEDEDTFRNSESTNFALVDVKRSFLKSIFVNANPNFFLF